QPRAVVALAFQPPGARRGVGHVLAVDAVGFDHRRAAAAVVPDAERDARVLDDPLDLVALLQGVAQRLLDVDALAGLGGGGDDRLAQLGRGRQADRVHLRVVDRRVIVRRGLLRAELLAAALQRRLADVAAGVQLRPRR